MFLHIIDAKYVDGYKIKVTFNNGQEGVADLSKALTGPVFEGLKNKSSFAAFSLDTELNTITWPNGADLAPEYIYFQAFKNDPAQQSQFKKWGYIS
ncbi:MAG: DUF2442 domain-containing protein [Bacteroidales bacterium]|nr:DUF2442 domain-containing protein [Bacteroidales bacterium]MCF8458224.1 DUF2442 domain-containing protein [Bacteroidales bacterium]